MKNKRPMNNEEFVNHIMTIGGITGALKQIFILEAISHYVTDIIEDEDTIIAQEDEDIKNGKHGLINMRAWVRCAHEIEDLIANRNKLMVKSEECDEYNECDASELDLY